MKYYIILLLISICVFGQSNTLHENKTELDQNTQNAKMQLNKTVVSTCGTARLIDGLCEIAVENLPEEYCVQVTPLGETEGLYVFNKTAKSFYVKEKGQGKSNIEFDYIVFKNLRNNAVRRDDVIDRAETVGGDRQPVSSTASSSGDSDK